jgi:hypothetical protein
MAWETPRSWWSQGYTAPLERACESLSSVEVAWEDNGRYGPIESWEIRVDSKGTAYTYCVRDFSDLLLIRELPHARRPPKETP